MTTASTQTPTSTKVAGWRRKVAAIALAAAAAAGLSLVSAAPAQAYQYQSGGYTGRSSSSDVGRCKHQANGDLLMTVSPPAVTGADLSANKVDYTWIRYKAYLVNANNGASLAQTGWSGWMKLADNKASQWTGTTSLAGNGRGNYVVDFRIEWWNDTKMLGWSAHRVSPYNYYTVNNVSYGRVSTCARY